MDDHHLQSTSKCLDEADWIKLSLGKWCVDEEELCSPAKLYLFCHFEKGGPTFLKLLLNLQSNSAPDSRLVPLSILIHIVNLK